VAHDDAHQAHDAKERHEPERRAHDAERGDSADHAVRNGPEDDLRFDRVLELHREGQEDPSL
jgi:hypothetical protein